MLQYLLEASVCWLAFYLVYALLLSRETFFQLNRWYLLGTLFLGGIIPWLELPKFLLPEQPAPILVQLLPGLNIQQPIAIAEVPATPMVSFLDVLAFLYWLGVVLAGLRFAYGLWQLASLYQKSKKQHLDSYTLVLTNEKHLPFSFFNYLFKSSFHQTNEEDQSQITKHELAHIHGWHTLDVLFMEVIGIITWCCPPVYLYRRSLRVVHEYIADAAVLRTSNRKHYGQMLITQSQSGLQIALVNHLIHSQLKKRIFMMTKDKSRHSARYKYFLLLPLLCLMLAAFARHNETLLPLSSVEQEDISMLTESKTNGDVDEMPRFPGCEAIEDAEHRKVCAQKHLFQFIFDNLKYPEAAKKANIQGTVIVQFSVDTDGSIIEPTILKSLGGGCDEEVLRMMGQMPKWIPGKKEGKTVKVEMKLPIQFKFDTKDRAQTNKTGEVFKVVEEMPLFPGCEASAEYSLEKKKCSDKKLLEFIFNNVKYPKEAKDTGEEGMVVVSFIVDRTGQILEPEIIRGSHPALDKEVLRVVSMMPRWTPGRQKGKDVSVQFNLPVRFTIAKEDKENVTANPMPQPSANVLELAEFSASPNPTDGIFTLRFKAEPKPINILITNNAGKELYRLNRQDFDGTFNEEIDLGNTAKGTLIITVQQGEQHYSSKLIMQ